MRERIGFGMIVVGVVALIISKAMADFSAVEFPKEFWLWFLITVVPGFALITVGLLLQWPRKKQVQ